MLESSLAVSLSPPLGDGRGLELATRKSTPFDSNVQANGADRTRVDGMRICDDDELRRIWDPEPPMLAFFFFLAHSFSPSTCPNCTRFVLYAADEGLVLVIKEPLDAKNFTNTVYTTTYYVFLIHCSH